MVKIDVGCRLNGYCSDMTRTVFLGEPTEQFVELYNVVLDAQEAALEVVRAGLSCAELDGTARAAIEAAGFGEYFTHSLGHGVGLEVHEAPRVSTRSDETLEAGMVVTVEPGIYIEDWGGIRIEDLVVVTEDGCEVLTETPKMRY
jgi:Xaa-Pro aminopeptidase